jgi:hypothetical protein
MSQCPSYLELMALSCLSQCFTLALYMERKFFLRRAGWGNRGAGGGDRMRLRGVHGGRAGLHVCTQRDQPLRAVCGRELPVRGVLVRQHVGRLCTMHACSRRGAGIQTGKELQKNEKWREKWGKQMLQTRKVYKISK